MRVIKNNFKEKEITICSNCLSELEVDKSDIKVGEYGIHYITCPCCGQDVYLDSNVDLNKDNIEFPLHFAEYGDSAVDVPNDLITKYVKECLKNMEDNNEPYSYMASGDTFICVFREDGELYVVVTKNYLDCYVFD